MGEKVDGRSVPKLCGYCGGTHFAFKVCDEKRAAKQARLERDAPGVVRFGDRTRSFAPSGGTLWLADPHPRPPTVHVPDDWNEEAR